MAWFDFTDVMRKALVVVLSFHVCCAGVSETEGPQEPSAVKPLHHDEIMGQVSQCSHTRVAFSSSTILKEYFV